MPVDLAGARWRAPRRGQVLGARHRARAGAHERQQPALERALVQLDVEAELVAPDHVEERLQGDALGVEPQLVAESSTRRSPSILPLWVRKAA